VHQEEMNQIFLNADESLRGVGDDGREGNNKRNERDSGRACAYSH